MKEQGHLVGDFHIHTEMCGHATGTVDEMVEAAISMGFRRVGISDHMPMLYGENTEGYAMSPEMLPVYVDKVLEAKERYADRIEVLLGIEADYYLPTQEQCVEILSPYDFDYIIGSVHCLDGWLFDSPDEVSKYDDLDLDAFFLEYFDAVEELVRTGLYDIVGHLDLAKKFGRFPSVDLTDRYRALLGAMKEYGVAYEINTAGLRWPADEMYPSPAFVRLAAAAGVPVTLGSDAHKPEQVGLDFDRAVALIRQSGYDRVALFRERRMVEVELA